MIDPPTGAGSSLEDVRAASRPVVFPGQRTTSRRQLLSRRVRDHRRTLLLGLLVLVAAWIVASGLLAVFGLLDASHGMTEVQAAKGRLSASDIVSQSALGPLKAARANFASSEGLLHSPLLTPFEVLPVMGRQLRSVQDLSTAAERTTQIGISALGRVRAVLDVPHQGGPDRVATLRHLELLATQTNAQLSTINTGPSDALLSPLAHKRASFVSQLDNIRTRLEHAATVAQVTAEILQGPQSYLVLMANPAEMRSGSGAFLEVGVMSSQDGQVHLTGTVPSATLSLPPGKVTVGGDLEARWGWTDPGVDWRNLGLTPQFDVNAPLAARMWEAATGQHVDGVLAVDVQALQQILEVTGPVTLDNGQVVSTDTVVPLLTHDQYAGLTDEQTSSGAQAQQARQDELGQLAHSALSTLDSESLDLKALADAMTVSTQGRHIMLWSDTSSAEAAWRDGGVAGQLSSHSLMASVVNAGANKLDQYLRVQCHLAITATGSAREATLVVNMQNVTPSGQSQFIAGPFPGLGTAYGEYEGLLTLNLPAGSSHIALAGNPPIAAEGEEGQTWLVATLVDVKQGQSERVELHFDLPSVHGQMTVVPSARLDPVQWSYPTGSTTDAAPFEISW